MSDLLPCPFCGRKPYMAQDQDGNWLVKCVRMECLMSMVSTGWRDTDETVANNWNTRYAPTTPQSESET